MADAAYETIVYRLADGVAEITLNQPDTLNALTTTFGEELLAAFRRGEQEGRCILLRAAGRGFCSGASLAGGRFDLDDPDRDVGARLDTLYHPLIVQMRNVGVPIIAAVNGPAAGIGCALALAADLILAAERAYFFLSFAAIGLVPDGGLAYLLSRAVGRPRATEMMLLGERISARQAAEWGLINRAVADADLDDAARGMALRLARGPASIGLIRRMAWDALDGDFGDALAQERVAQRTAGRTDDFVEGVRAFQEKRRPCFTGE